MARTVAETALLLVCQSGRDARVQIAIDNPHAASADTTSDHAASADTTSDGSTKASDLSAKDDA
jgi:hypothetical protein